ncbi:MAG: YebC/PmpR family DNA-binding transcriptional regulator [Magnetococcales bacterium]|nr:YebC/PmpR family DNA-binding transcriptional regulator [Magnetococcales bacterium]
MAGHSKWANIKHRKDAQDVKRGKIFTKLIREITVAAKIGGEDISANPRLRTAVQAARSQSMSKDTIDKAIKRGAGNLEGSNYSEVRFEGYGPGGVAVIVDTLTDNNNRTVADVRHIFSRCGGNLGTSGCVAYLFDARGQILFQGVNEDALMEAAVVAGADDMRVDEETLEVLTTPERLEEVREALANAGFDQPISCEVAMIPQDSVTVDDLKKAENLLKLMDLLEDYDDVQKAYANFDLPDHIMAQLG